MALTDRESYRVEIPVFHGPLDLLLSLIVREELDISLVSLAQVADQFLEYLATVEQVQPESLVDFLVVASRLLLIKSNSLLPRPPSMAGEGEGFDGDDLLEQLRLYQQFKQAAQQLKDRHGEGLRTFVRLAPPPRIDPRLDLSDVSTIDLLAAVQEALSLPPPAPSVNGVVSKRVINIAGQMDTIRNRVSNRQTVTFRKLLAATTSRLEIAVTLLATLELIKQHEINVYQEELFGPIYIRAREQAFTANASM